MMISHWFGFDCYYDDNVVTFKIEQYIRFLKRINEEKNGEKMKKNFLAHPFKLPIYSSIH